MGKLFNLKKWLTVADAARHLSIVFGEDVTEADVLRLGRDGHLQLSVHLVNHARGRCGQVVPIDEAKFEDVPSLCGEHAVRLFRGPILPGGSQVLELSDAVEMIEGVWDLPMVGAEQLDIEHSYQALTGGPSITLINLEGAFVARESGRMCQLQESYDDNEYQAGSTAALARLKQHIAENGTEGAEAQSLLNLHTEERKAFLENQKTRPKKENYYPAGGLPEDAVIVVRTEALREFESQSTDEPSPASHAHVSDKLAKMNQASTRFWSNAERGARGTHPDNATVAAWLVEQGFSPTLADKAATIIRPEWAPTGRKPEE